MTKNRLLLITPDYPPPQVGGSLVYMYTLVEGCDESFDILTAPLPEGFSEVTSPRHRVIRSPWLVPSGPKDPTNGQLFAMYVYLAYWAVKIGLTRRYDGVVFFASAIGNGFFSALFKLMGVKIVLFAFAEEITLAQRAPGMKGALKRVFMKGYSLADGYVCICDFVKDLIVSLGGDGARMCVIPTPISPAKSVRHQSQTRRETSGHNVLTAGRLVYRKGFHLVIDAVDRLRAELPDIHLTIVGDGPEMPRLTRQVEEKGLKKHVTFAGMVSDDSKIAGYYADCDLFVLANLFLPDGNCEGSPNVLIEASAQGKPVIGGREGGTSTAVRDGVTGFLVDPADTAALADKMRTILTDRELAKRLGEAGRRKIESEHDPIKAGERFSRFMREVIPSASPR